MKPSVFLSASMLLTAFIFSCSKTRDCEENNTGTVMIHNDGPYMPSGTADFFLGSRKLASLSNGQETTVDNIPAGAFIVTVKIGTDTVYVDEYVPDTVVQCETLHYSTDKFLPVSDKRLKKDITPLHHVLASIGKLNIYSYLYQAPAGYTGFLPGGQHYGYMAQELKEVYPDFVLLNNNGYYTVNYQEMIPVLTKGMQEQQEQIEGLKKELAELKSLIVQQQATASK